MTTPSFGDLGHKFFGYQDRLRGGPDPALCAPDYVARIGSNPPMTLADHEGFGRAFYGGFPDLRHRIEETIVSGDTVVVRFTLIGTHRGEFMGIPPTQKAIDVGAIAIFRTVDGRIAEIRGQFDQLGMMRQLGVLQ
jgi:ketosteroid isomerase-like protein